MFNERLLRSYIVLQGLTFAQIAEKLGIHEATLGRKIKRGGTFTRAEIYKIKTVLELSDEEMISIFFANELT